ncbi:MAG: glucokinase [Rhodocyclaceae bacterium]|nr:glucokinase [Rhodocyclaceae bacterium]
MPLTHSYPLLLGDIGGTHARFAWLTEPGTALSHVETLVCSDYANFEDALAHYVSSSIGTAKPMRASLAIASAVPKSGPIKVTNGYWVLNREHLRAMWGMSEVTVYNDFEAIAFVLPHLDAGDYRTIGTARPDGQSVMAVIGPGTGLGVATTVPIVGQPGAWQAVCGEGGHATLAAASPYQANVIAAARARNHHVSAERFVSGVGLPELYRAVAEVEGLPADHSFNAERIGSLGSANLDPLCRLTMNLFCEFLGNVAGNLALTTGARGGVFIGGGIIPKLGEFFFQSGFREYFESKGSFQHYLVPISTALITTPYPALLGLAHHANNPRPG